MRGREIKHIAYSGPEGHEAFIRFFNLQLLTALKKRGLLTERQYQKGLAFLGAGK